MFSRLQSDFALPQNKTGDILDIENFGGIWKLDNLPWPQSRRRRNISAELFSGGLDAWQAVTSPQARPPRALSASVAHCSSGFDYSIQPLSEPLSAKMFGFGNPSLCLWANDSTFSLKSCIRCSLTVGDKISLNFLGCWFYMVVDLLQMVCLFPYLSANPSTYYLFESLLKQQTNSFKKKIKLYFSSG